MTSKEAVLKSAELRGKHKFREAIDTIKSNLSVFDPDIILNAYLEMFLAAKEAGFTEEACEYAKKVLQEDPDVPSAKQYVASHCAGI